ncbi:MAG: pyroglutamyl-peptidase I [Myxococcales bacterium]|nr:pyroglutamyl-peptidase I [Myxococcales bacterium]
MANVVTGTSIDIAPPRAWLTGFGPFPGVPDNPSAAVVRALTGSPEGRWAGRGTILPVRFAGTAERLRPIYAAGEPRVVIHLGVAGRRRLICVERGARNRVDPSLPDAVGQLATQSRCSDAQPAASRLHTQLPVHHLVAGLRRAGFGARVSEDAGTYVCNYSYYHALAEQRRGAAEALFVHIPPIGATDAQTGQSWTLERLVEATKLLCVSVESLGCRSAPNSGYSIAKIRRKG